MAFAPKPGCPMCGIVATAVHSQIDSPSFQPAPPIQPTSAKPDILWRDENFTVYREKEYPVSSKAHIIIAFNLHVPSIYTLSSTDLPLLLNIKEIAKRTLSHYLPTAAVPASPNPSTFLAPSPHASSFNITQPPLEHQNNPDFRIGFITPPFRDNKIPVTGHLHAHAYIMPADLMGWFRAVAYSAIAWYDIDDLIAEIRESTSNNRIRSADTKSRPIDHVPGAGARSGFANGQEIMDSGLSAEDANLEDGIRTPRTPRSPGTPPSPTTATALDPEGTVGRSMSSPVMSSSSLLPSSQIPSLSV